MGGGVILFGLSVILVYIVQRQHGAEAGPIPSPDHYDICAHYNIHSHRYTTTPAPGTTTAAPKKDKPDKPKEELIEKLDKILRQFLDLDKKNKEDDEEEEKKKKEEEEKKKKEEEEEEKKKKKNRPRGFPSWDEFWDDIFNALW